MIRISGFSQSSLELANSLLFAEGQVNPLAGECGQKEKRKAMAKPRTPAQEAADKMRSQQQSGKTIGSSSVRSAAAKKAAETRARCKGGGTNTGPTA